MTRYLLCGLAAALAIPTQAQSAPTITVSNGAVLTVSNGAVVDLQGGTLDLGGVGETARLAETDGGRVANATLFATRTLTAPSAENVAGLGFTITTDADLGATTVYRLHGPYSVDGEPAAERQYEITPSNGDPIEATVSLAYAEAELGGLDEATLAAYLQLESGFEALDSAPDPAANTVVATGVTELGTFVLAGEGAVPEPATVVGSLAYGTCPEPPAALAGARPRCFVQVSGTNLLATPQRYTIFLLLEGADDATDAVSRVALRGEIKLGPGESATNQMKLQMREDDPAGAYTVTVVAEEGSVPAPTADAVVLDAITVVKGAGAGLRVDAPLAAYPNPAGRRATLAFAVAEATEAAVVVYDALGREVARPIDGEVEGLVETALDAGRLATGLYVVRLTTTSGRTETVRLSVVR